MNNPKNLTKYNELFEQSNMSDSDDSDDSDDQPYKKSNHTHPNNSINRSNRLPTVHAIDPSYDGINRTGLMGSKNINDKYVQAECCGLYFLENAFYHRTKGFGIEGMVSCIHCYIALNAQHYNSDNLKPTEKTLLVHYIEEFTQHHDAKKCKRESLYGNCFLCDKLLDIVPKSIDLPKPVVVEEINGSVFSEQIFAMKKSPAIKFSLCI